MHRQRLTTTYAPGYLFLFALLLFTAPLAAQPEEPFDLLIRGGRVVDERASDEDTRAIRSLNVKVNADGRVDATMLPIGDGLTLAVKR